MTVSAPPRPLEIGDHVPPFELRTPQNDPQGLGQLSGKSLVMLFYPRLDEASIAELRRFQQAQQEFDQLNARVLAHLANSPEDLPQRLQAASVTVPVLVDVQQKVSAAFGLSNASDQRWTFVVDPAFRVVAQDSGEADDAHVQQVLSQIRQQIAPEPPRVVSAHAPVLLVANVLPPDLCRRLIEIWETQGNEDSGSMVMRDGKTVPVYNYDHKIRRDHFMKSGPDEEQVKGYIGRRVLPEMRKAFNYNVTRREDFRIACYDASRGGYFRPHRDNTTEGTAHRRFAMSLLLNDDYEGGYLRFPEFGRDMYRPRAGAAVVFSCSLLHEATDVTAGRRFVLLSFFYGEHEARLREEYNKRTGGQYRA